jgi:hypothetical protein
VSEKSPQLALEWLCSTDPAGKLPQQTARLAAAYHEAGHIRPLEQVPGVAFKVQLDDTGGGKLVITRLPNNLNDPEVSWMILLALASGQATQHRYLNYDCNYNHWVARKIANSSSSRDREIFKQFAEAAGYKSVNAEWDKASQQASKFKWKIGPEGEWEIEIIAKKIARNGRYERV